MATPDTSSAVDTRNLTWKSNNVGSKLLEKMGWKDGQGIGKRAPKDQGANVSSEGLRVRKRADGLGLGASSATISSANNTSHVAGFSELLKSLQDQHKTKEIPKKKRKKSKASLPVFATNKSTNHKVRAAKFQTKNLDDMKAIFGGVTPDFPTIVQAQPDSHSKEKRKKKKSNK